MNRTSLIATSLTGLAALALAASHSAAATMGDAGAASEKCYGVAAAGKNDCAAGAHSCAGQASKNFDKSSYILLPAGLCARLAGGSTMASK